MKKSKFKILIKKNKKKMRHKNNKKVRMSYKIPNNINN